MDEKELEKKIIEFEKWWRKKYPFFNNEAPYIIRAWYRFLEEEKDGGIAQSNAKLMDSDSIREKNQPDHS